MDRIDRIKGLSAPINHPEAKQPLDDAVPLPTRRPALIEAKKGDTFWSLAKEYGTTPQALMHLNRGTKPRRIQVGQMIKLPGHAGRTGPRASQAQPIPGPAALWNAGAPWETRAPLLITEKYKPFLAARGTAQEESARTALRTAIEAHLLNGAAPKDASEADVILCARALEAEGPQDAAFRSALEEAFHTVVVKWRAKAVADAYANGGAAAAARELAAQMRDVIPATAKQVLEASMPDIMRIADDIRHRAEPFTTLPAAAIRDKEFVPLIGHLSRAAEAAARDPHGGAAVLGMAAVLADPLTAGLNSPAKDYRGCTALTSAVAEGDTALPLAIASALQQAGDTRRANAVLSYIASGVRGLQAKVDKAVAGHLLTPLNRFEYDHAHLPPQDLAQAKVAYERDHPESREEYGQTLRAVDALAVKAARTVLAVDRAMPRFQGLAGHAQTPVPLLVDRGIPQFQGYAGLENALRSSQQDIRMQFAIASSGRTAREVSYQAWLEVEREQSSEAPGMGKPQGGTKSTFGELVKSLAATSSTGALFDSEWFDLKGKFATKREFTDVFSGRANTLLDTKKALPANLPFNLAGVLIFGGQLLDASAEFQQRPESALNAAKGVYATLGLSKEVAETLAIGVQKNWLPWGMSAEMAASILAKSQRGGMLNFSSLAKDPRAVQFGYGLKMFGSALDAANAIRSFREGENLGGALYGTSAFSGLLGASSSLARSGWWGNWGAAFGGSVSLAASLGLYVYQDYKAARGFEHPAREFLVHAGINPKVADTLANSDSDGRSAGPVFAAMLKEAGIGKQEFKRFLNSLKSEEDLAKLDELVERARRVWPGEHGDFPRRAFNDNIVQAFPYWITRIQDSRITGGRGARLYDPHSLNGLLVLAHELFGARFPGPSRLPDRP
jgi:hypothetical protein